jgi:tripartite-type tricarboxylate transporter receptor subunit TctC
VRVRWLAIAVGVASFTHLAPSFAAESYPSKPIRLVVPFAPGGGSDALARIVAQRMTENVGQTIVVDNRPGAASRLGSELVATSPPDGYTLLLGDLGLAINSAYYKRQVRFDVLKSFKFVALLAEAPYALFVYSGVPASSLNEFIALAKAQPGKISVGSSGYGGGPHMTLELFKLNAGINLHHIPYKGGGQSQADLLSGQIQAIFGGTGSGVTRYVSTGRLKALAVASPKRSGRLPDVPTFTELGLDIVVTNWYGLVAPANTPASVVKRLYDEAVRATSQADIRERLVSGGFEPIVQSPGDFQKLVESEVKRWAQVVKDANVQTE